MVTNGSRTQTFRLHTTSKAEKQHWIEALERSKAQNIEIIETAREEEAKAEDDGFESSDNALGREPQQVRTFSDRLNFLTIHYTNTGTRDDINVEGFGK